MAAKDDLHDIFRQFRALLRGFEKGCIVEKDTDSDYYLNSKTLDQTKKPIFFAATSINKISVSFYLMPVYLFPDLLDSVSPELRKHLHGKSCFRFTTLEPALRKELSSLTKRSADRLGILP